jgi:hypothetical protein
MKNKTIKSLIALLALALAPGIFAQGTAFTYQGRLDNDGGPADGLFDIRFSVWSASAGPTQVGSTLTNTAVEVTDGLFTVNLDFGSSVFTGPDRWLEVGVKTNGGGVFTTLAPRKKITAAPYASYSGTASTVPNSSIGSAQIAPDSITSSDLGPDSVGTSEVINNSLLAADIAAGAVGTSEVADGSLLGLDLADNTVGSLQLASSISLGDTSTFGRLDVYKTSTSGPAITLTSAGTGGYLTLYQEDGQNGVFLDGDSGGGGLQYLYAADGSIGIILDGESVGAGLISLHNTNGSARISLDGSGNSGGGQITVNAGDGGNGIILYGDSGGGGLQYLYAADGSIGVALDGESAGAGYISVRDSASNVRVALDGESAGTGGEISVYDDNGTETIEILGAEDAATGGQILMRNASGITTIQLDSDASGVACGYIRLYKSNGAVGVTIEGDNGGDGRVTTQELAITGGSDLSEQFDIHSDAELIQPGALVCIDPLNPGKLVVSQNAYDRTVAGVVSGAGGIKPGMMMGQRGSVADGEHAVALTGRVYCMVDADQGAILPGDLITTSGVPGHGMKVTNHSRAQGAIVGKAMTGLEGGKGLILVLVSLQ